MAILPWISDTFESHPESGLATVVLGEASSLFAVLLYLWHRRLVSFLAHPTATAGGGTRLSAFTDQVMLISCATLGCNASAPLPPLWTPKEWQVQRLAVAFQDSKGRSNPKVRSGTDRLAQNLVVTGWEASSVRARAHTLLAYASW